MTTRTPVRARATCATCGAAARAKDRFCASCGAPIAAAQAAPRPDAPGPGPAESASLQVAGHPATALAEQRKVVTILFADLSGSTPLAEKLDPEDLRGILGSYFATLARQIQRYEGTIDKYIGDAIMAVFGAPLSHEDDAERAIHAALAMQASIARLNDDLEREHGVRLSLRIGINTGEVVAGLLAGDVQRAYTVVGDAVNTAQRFESVAPVNGILVSETTRRLAIHAFEFETLPPVTLKGKAQAVAAYRVMRRRDEEIPPDASPLVGRQAELEWLRGALGGALAGSGRALTVIGEAGVGKSRLVAEFGTNLAAGVERFMVRSASYEANTPYALVAGLIRSVFRIHAADDEPSARAAIVAGFGRYGDEVDDGSLTLLLDILGYGERSVLEAERKRSVLTGILRALLARAGDRAPFVIAAEDVHWADTASVAVLAELAKDVPALPCVFVTTARPGWQAPWRAETLELGPLGDDDARTLLEAIVEARVDDALAARILARTGGNPFFIEEVVRSLLAARAIGERDGRVLAASDAPADLPASVQEVLQARLERLAEGPARVVQASSVIGLAFWYRVLERLVPAEPLAERIATLEQEAFVVVQSVEPELTYAFRQALIREVAYQTQLQSQRRRTHAAIGQAIESLFADRLDEFTDQLAYHYDRSDDVPRALRWLVRAGDRARSLYANDEALALYGAALRRAADGDGPLEAGTVIERIADVQLLTGRYDEAVASLGAARARLGAPRPATVARLHRKTGTAFVLKGDRAEASAAFAEGVAALGAAADAEAARIGVQRGLMHFRAGEYVEARAALAEAVALGERLGADDVLAEGLKLLGNVANNLGDLKGADDTYRRARAVYERLGDEVGRADLHNQFGLLYRRMGRFAEALAEDQEVLRLRERTGHVWGLAIGLNNLGELHRTLDEPTAAVPLYERALEIFERIGERVYAAAVLMNLGAARAEAGDATAGRDDLLEAEQRMLALGGTKFLPSVYRDLASATLAAGDLAAATGHAERSLALARQANVPQTEAKVQRILGQIALARGDRARARALLEESRAAFEKLGEAAELRRTEVVLATL